MKNKPKITAIAISLALALPLSAAVQAYPSAERMADRLIQKLDLDDGRAEEVRQIMQSSHEKQMALYKQVREEMEALRAETYGQLEQVLTEDEMAKLKEMQREKSKAFRNGPHHKSGEHGKRSAHEGQRGH